MKKDLFGDDLSNYYKLIEEFEKMLYKEEE